MDKELIEYIKYGVWILFGSGFLFEIAPIKFSPFTSLLGWLGNKLNRDMKKDLSQLQTNVKAIQADFQDHKVESQRRNILNFADKLMRGEQKTKEDFEAIIKMHDDYDDYITINRIPNGQIDLAFDYISRCYQECRTKNNFYIGK